MTSKENFTTIGRKTDNIDVRLSYKIVELFSEGLYASPNKAIEELVANSFDAGATSVQLLMSPNLHDQSATIVVIDDGEGMDVNGLKKHWLIGKSSKRALSTLPRGRQQIGKFGIGKLATYVLASQLTHVCKFNGEYFSTSMDYSVLDTRVDREVEPQKPLQIPLRSLNESEARDALAPWTSTKAFQKAKKPLFGPESPDSWTVAIMSSLKDKVHEIVPGMLNWVLRTALPLRPDFSIWMEGKKLVPSKQGKGLVQKWTIGKDLTKLPKPIPKNVSASVDSGHPPRSEHRHGLDVPRLGRVTGFVEVYKDLLTGKSDAIGRSHGFFVYVFGRLVNVEDGHFGIPPNELRHGTFGRMRVVVHMDGLDKDLRSNRETLSAGPLLEDAQNLLRSVFNAVRPTLERHDADESPGAKLARKLASSPSSLSRRPIFDLAIAVVQGNAESNFLNIPKFRSTSEKDDFLQRLEERLENNEELLKKLSIDYKDSSSDFIARFDLLEGQLRINAWHPFVATFHDEFTNKNSSQPLEILAMSEILAESQLHMLGVKHSTILDYLHTRDQLIRYLANESGRQSALAVSNNLINNRNNASGLEGSVCDAFSSLGFEVTPLAKKGEPDGVANANTSAQSSNNPTSYKISLEAKSKVKDGKKVSAKSVGISTIARQRDDWECDHSVVVGPAFPTTQGDQSALLKEIDTDRKRTAEENNGHPKTITLITIDDLAKLVRLRPIKQLGLQKLRTLFSECRSPEESHDWVNKIAAMQVTKPPYRRIIQTIEATQRKFKRAPVTYAALRTELSHLDEPIIYETDNDLHELCKGMAQMAPGAIHALDNQVELDQSTENVLSAIDAATQEYPLEEQ